MSQLKFDPRFYSNIKASSKEWWHDMKCRLRVSPMVWYFLWELLLPHMNHWNSKEEHILNKQATNIRKKKLQGHQPCSETQEVYTQIPPSTQEETIQRWPSCGEEETLWSGWSSSLGLNKKMKGKTGGRLKEIQISRCLEGNPWKKQQFFKSKVDLLIVILLSHTIHVWYIYLHLVDLYGKCS